MDWLVLLGRRSIRSLIGAALVLTPSTVLIGPAEAAQIAAQSQLSFTCHFTNGPRTGQNQSYEGFAGIEAAPVGTFCADGQDSTGMVVPDDSAPPPVPVAPVQPPLAPASPATTFICRFDSGPRAGQSQSYSGVTGMHPMPVGAQCTDGQGSTGVAIVAPPVSPPTIVQTAPPAPKTSSTCEFNNGPRAGQVQTYVGVTGMQAMLLGAPCTDGQGSAGVAVPDVPLPSPPAAVQAPLPAEPPTSPTPPPAPSVQQPVAVQPPPDPSQHKEAMARPLASHRKVIAGAAVGAPIHAVPGAVWADPENTGYVTGYTINGRYHVGRPATDHPIFRAISAPAPRRAAPAVRLSADLPIVSIVGRPVAGLPGAVWADFNNDGVVDGYIYNGEYLPGRPSGHTASSAPLVPSAPTVPILERSGERG